jgi:hypothetical protein
MSHSLWRCRNRDCPVPGGAVLGRVADGGGLVLAAGVDKFRIFLDTRRTIVTCPGCGTEREFRGAAIFSTEVADDPLTDGARSGIR